MVGTSYMGHDYVRTILSLYTLFTAFSTFYVLPPSKQSVEKVWVNSLLFVVVVVVVFFTVYIYYHAWACVWTVFVLLPRPQLWFPFRVTCRPIDIP